MMRYGSNIPIQRFARTLLAHKRGNPFREILSQQLGALQRTAQPKFRQARIRHPEDEQHSRRDYSLTNEESRSVISPSTSRAPYSISVSRGSAKRAMNLED